MFNISKEKLLFINFEGDAKYDPSVEGVKDLQIDDSDNKDSEGVAYDEKESDNESKVNLCDRYSLASESNAK